MAYVQAHINDSVYIDVYSFSEAIASDPEAASECLRRLASEMTPNALLKTAQDIFEQDEGDQVKMLLASLYRAINNAAEADEPDHLEPSTKQALMQAVDRAMDDLETREEQRR